MADANVTPTDNTSALNEMRAFRTQLGMPEFHVMPKASHQLEQAFVKMRPVPGTPKMIADIKAAEQKALADLAKVKTLTQDK
jgi:hypothetical protein